MAGTQGITVPKESSKKKFLFYLLDDGQNVKISNWRSIPIRGEISLSMESSEMATL